MTYHSGSRAVQDRVGVRDLADHVGQAVGQGIRPVAAAFLEQQPMLVAGAADPATGAVWASLLTGPPGFVRATGVRQISVTGRPSEDDPLAAALAAEGTLVGTIALDPRTRRRMRLNGRSRPTAGGSPWRPTGSSPTARSTCSAGSPTRRSGVGRARPAAPAGSPPAARPRRGRRHLLPGHRPRARRRRQPPGRQPGLRPRRRPLRTALARLPRQLHVPDPRQPGGGPEGRTALPGLDVGNGAPAHRHGPRRVRPGRGAHGPLHRHRGRRDARGQPLRWSPPEYSPANPSLP